MKLIINNDTVISEVQEKFSAYYPYLKIDFYKTSKEQSALFEVSDQIKPHEKFSKFQSFSEPVEIDISPERTVMQVENDFYDQCGIVMQVSRKSGHIWIQTSRTDYRTLQMQNESGEAMSAMEGN